MWRAVLRSFSIPKELSLINFGVGRLLEERDSLCWARHRGIEPLCATRQAAIMNHYMNAPTNGSPGWDRTNDLVINSHSLLPLSYWGIVAPTKGIEPSRTVRQTVMQKPLHHVGNCLALEADVEICIPYYWPLRAKRLNSRIVGGPPETRTPIPDLQGQCNSPYTSSPLFWLRGRASNPHTVLDGLRLVNSQVSYQLEYHGIEREVVRDLHPCCPGKTPGVLAS